MLLDFVGVRPLTDDGVDRRREKLGVVDVRACYDDAQGAAIRFDDEAALGARLPSIRRIRANLIARVSCFRHGPVDALPPPLHQANLIGVSYEPLPDRLHNAVLTPLLEPAVQGALGAEKARDFGPLAATSQTEDDAIENSTEIDTRAADHLRWRILEKKGLDLTP